MSAPETHIEFIQARLPAWLKRASRVHQERFKVLTQQLQRDSDALNALLVDLPVPQTFTYDVLTAQPEVHAWQVVSGPVDGTRIAVDAVRRARVKRAPYTPSQSLIEAAMRNYPPADAATDGDFDKKGQLFIQGNPQEFYQWDVPVDSVVLPTTPAEFARICRRANVGGAYRKALERKLPRIRSTVPTVASAYMAYARSLLAHDAYEAKLDGRLDDVGERLLADAGVHLENKPVVPLACEIKSLEFLSVPLFGARVYWGVKGDANGVRPIVLHIPHDPVAPVRQFPSLQAMSAELTARIRQRSYRQSLMRYFPLRLQAQLGEALHDQVEWRVEPNPNLIQEIYGRISGWRDGERGEDGSRRRIRIPVPRVTWSLRDLRVDPWHAYYHEWRGNTLANAAALMVPTEDLDWQALLARLAYWEGLVERSLMLAAVFFPFFAPIGMTAGVVGGVRLVYEIFEGIQAFNEGHSQEAIEHIFNVLFGIAQGAYLGFVGAVIEPMPVSDGSTRLWNGDVEPFAARRLPPVEAVQDAWGVWRTADDAWVQVEERYFEVRGAGDNLALRLPAGHRGVRPPLEWSRARGWQWAHRNPLQRSNLQLLHNFAETPSELDDSAILAVQRQVGISEAHLRYLQVEGHPMPAILSDALAEARNWQWVRHTIEQLSLDKAPGRVHFRTLQILLELPGWPEGVAVHYNDGEQLYSMGNATSRRSLLLTESDLEDDTWASRILAGFSTDEQAALLGQNSFGLSALERSRRLAGLWARQLENNTKRIIAGMARSTGLDPLAAPLVRDFPGLPESMATELASQSVGQDRVRLQEGRVSAGLGSQCAEALRELRLSRALRDLERGESSADRDRIVMGLVGRTPQLQSRVRLRLLLREALSPIEVGEAGPWKIIRQEDELYRPFDDEGNELADALGLEDALLRAMPDDARQALGLNIWEGTMLRTRLLAQALDDRQGLRPYLMMRRLDTSGARLQWMNGRLGYPASGRGRLPLMAWRNGLSERLERLYPSYAGPDLEMLKDTLAQQARSQGVELQSFVTRLENEWTTLDNELQQWETHQGLHHPAEGSVDVEIRLSQRRAVAAQIRSAWRRVPDPSNEGSDMALRLGGQNIGRLPPISVGFEHIEELVLIDMGLSEDPSDFLRLFPNIDTLHLQGNQFTAIPLAAGQLRGLMELSLSATPLALTADVFAPLLGPDLAPQLEILDLSGIRSNTGMAVSAIGRLAELPSLREVSWSDNIHFTEEQLRAITALPQLSSLDLSRCGLRLDEEGSQFLRSATALEDLSLNGNNCRDLPDLPELVALRDLELSDTGLTRVPALALAMLSRPSAEEVDSIDLSNNNITDIQDDLLPVLERLQGGTIGVLLDDNPLPSVQINALHQWDNGIFRYTIDDWLYINPGLRSALEAARDDAVNREFIDWFSGMMRDSDRRTALGLTFQDRTRGALILEHFIGYQNANEPLSTSVPDFAQRMTELRVRLRDRALDRLKPNIWELELHMMMFESVLRARLEQQSVPFASFLVDQYAYWTHVQIERFPDVLERQPHMTREHFINWLSDAQDTFNNNDQNPRVGEMIWRPYLGIMSEAWAEGLEAWAGVDETIIDAYSESVNPSSWPQVLLDNLARPDADLPSAWEPVTQGDQHVWRRTPLEPVADVEWTAGQPVTLTEDQLRRTMAIYRSVRSQQIEALVRRITADLVNPWWPLRPR